MADDTKNLPESLKSHFWDCDFSSLSWPEQSDFIIRRILQAGSWESITWLRAELGDPELTHWIVAQRGAGLSPRQLRFWEVVLGLPRASVTLWLNAAVGRIWERRLSR